MGNEGAAAGLGVRTGLRPRRRLVLAVEFSMVLLSCEDTCAGGVNSTKAAAGYFGL